MNKMNKLFMVMSKQDLTSSNISERPTFIIDGKPYISAGVLFYTEDMCGRIYLLMQKVSNRDWIWSDFGGKSEPIDKCVEDVAFRECQRGLNFKADITTEYLRELMKSKKSTIYKVSESKYMLYIIYLPYSFKETVDMEIFGKCEEFSNNCRTVRWISYYDFNKAAFQDINPRLKPEEFKTNLPLIISNGMSLENERFY